MGRNASDRTESPARGRWSPRRKSPSRREQSPMRHRSSRKDRSPAREKLSSRARSPKHEKSHSPVARSPSPRTKRLRRAQVEREAERATDRGREKNHDKGDDRGSHREKGTDRENGSGRKEKRSGREEIDYKSSRSRGGRSPSPSDRGKGDDRGSHREKGTDRENGSERKEKRSGREEIDYKSSRSRGGRSPSPSDRHHRSRPKSRSPQGATETRERDEDRNSRGANNQDDEDDSLAKMKVAEEALAAKKKQQPSFELSGKLAAETNKVRGITLQFTEPPEARKPDTRWRLYVFKGGEMLNEPFYIHRQSCYLFGRERRVADIPTDHPSCSKQHAVIQFRQVEKEQPDGTLTKQVRPYIMDLGSTNKTFINDSPVEAQRYYELFEKDTIKFGNSSREYVLLHENSAT